MKRLQTDYIDLYQSHIDDATTPLEETLEAYGELIRQGKVGRSGVQLHRRAAGPGLAVSKQNGLPTMSAFSRCTTSTTAPCSRTRSNRSAARPASASSLLLTRSGVLDGEVPIGAGPCSTCPGCDGQEVPQRPGLSHPSST